MLGALSRTTTKLRATVNNKITRFKRLEEGIKKHADGQTWTRLKRIRNVVFEMWECMGHSGLENRINNKWSRMNTSLRQGETAIDDALGLPIPCTAFSQAFSVNSLRWRFRGERAGNFLKDWASSGWIWNVICQNERMTDSLYYTWQDFERWEERLKLSAQKKALFMYFHMPYTPLPFASFRMQ